MNKYSKTAHIVEVIAVLVLGCLPGIIVLSTSNYQIGRFPPDTCFPSNDIIFHTFQFPFMIYATTILAMLFIVYSILRRVSIVSIMLEVKIHLDTKLNTSELHTYMSTMHYREPSQIQSPQTV